MKKKFSILIPTRERASTLYHTLRTCINQDYDNLEIVVSDNNSQDDTKDVVNSFNDKRIKYINTQKRVSMSDNFEFGVEHCSGEYIASIGDDDGLSIGAIERVNNVIYETGTQAITVGRPIYKWPSQNMKNSNQLHFELKKGYEYRDAKLYLNKVINEGMPYFEIPLLYYGFTDSNLIKKFKNKYKKIIHSSQVDMVSALAITSQVEKFVHIYDPIIIAGISDRSNGAAHFGVNKNKEEVDNWNKETNIGFMPPFELIPSNRILLLESLQRLKCLDEKLNFPIIKYKKIFTDAVIESDNKDYALKIVNIAKHFNVNIRNDSMYLKFRSKLYKLKKMFNYLIRFKKTRFVNLNLMNGYNIYDASVILDILYKWELKNLSSIHNQFIIAWSRIKK